MYIQRTVQQALQDLTKSFPYIVVYGPRQVGKSTTIEFTFGDEYNRVTLDDVEDRALAQSDPQFFLESHPWPLSLMKYKRLRFCWKSSRKPSIHLAQGRTGATADVHFIRLKSF